MMKKALVILSGGQDSTTCLYWAKQRFEQVCALTFDYGQRHRLEIESAKKIAAKERVPHEVIELGQVFDGLSPLTNLNLEVRKYESADKLPGGLENTFVPGRNILFLSVAGNRAYTLNCDAMIIGVAQEDFGGYPDCREDFINQMEKALSSGLGRELKILAPLMNLNKAQTVELAAKLPGCLEALALTTTCYNGSYPPCGNCHSCLLRSRGFADAKLPDPLLERAQETTAR